MKLLISAVVILPLFSYTESRSLRVDPAFYDWEKGTKEYEWNVLALNWLGEYCQKHACKKGWNNRSESLWDGKRMTIHGLQPQTKSGSFVRDMNCSGAQGSLFEIEDFSIENIFSDEPDVLQDLKKYWPNIQQSNTKVYENQWAHYGACYMINIIKSNPQYRKRWDADPNKTIIQLVKTYFKTTLTLTKNFNLKSNGQTYSDQTDFAVKLGFKQSEARSMYLVFNDDDQLDEIRICLTQTSVPGEEKIQECPQNHRFPWRNQPFKLPQRTFAGIGNDL